MSRVVSAWRFCWCKMENEDLTKLCHHSFSQITEWSFVTQPSHPARAGRNEISPLPKYHVYPLVFLWNPPVHVLHRQALWRATHSGVHARPVPTSKRNEANVVPRAIPAIKVRSKGVTGRHGDCALTRARRAFAPWVTFPKCPVLEQSESHFIACKWCCLASSAVSYPRRTLLK